MPLEWLKDYILPVLTPLADLAQILTFAAAVYIYFTKRDKLSALYRVIVGLRNQESFRELTKKLDHLDRLNIEVKEERTEASCLLAEISGQLRSNDLLGNAVAGIRDKLQRFLEGGEKMSEINKRQLTAELREALRGLNYDAVSRLTEEHNA